MMQSARAFRVALAALVLTSAGAVHAQVADLESHRAHARSAPMDPQAGLVYARALLRAGKVAEAGQELRRIGTIPAAKKGPVAIAIKYELARTAMASKDMYRAVNACRQVALVPGGEAMSHACTAEAYLTHRRASEALFEAEKAQASGEPLFEAKLAEGIAQEMALDEGEAEEALREAVRIAPERAEGSVALGRLLVNVGKRDEGLAVLRKGLELDPSSPEAAYELGRVLPAGPESLALLERATKQRERYGAALAALAGHALAAGRLGEARGSAEAALAIDTNDVAARLVLGQVAFAEGKNDEAIAQGKKVLGISPGSTKARMLVGDAQVRRGELEPAVESYSQAYGMDKHDPTPLLKAADAARRAGKLTTARAFAEKATRDFPKSASAWVTLGDVQAAEKDAAGAKAAYERALRAEGLADAAGVRKKLDALASK